jgi:hypothetical protein
MEWKYPMYPIKKKFISQPTAGKVMFTLFWVSQGPDLEHYQVWGVMINSACYSEMLCDKLKLMIQNKQ